MRENTDSLESWRIWYTQTTSKTYLTDLRQVSKDVSVTISIKGEKNSQDIRLIRLVKSGPVINITVLMTRQRQAGWSANTSTFYVLFKCTFKCILSFHPHNSGFFVKEENVTQVIKWVAQLTPEDRQSNSRIWSVKKNNVELHILLDMSMPTIIPSTVKYKLY